MNETIGLIGGLIGIVTAAVVLTRYLIMQQQERKLEAEQRKTAEKEAERKRLADQLEALKADRDRFRKDLDKASSKGGALMSLKLRLDEALRELMRRQDAHRGSIYAPVEPKQDVTALVFISIEPVDPGTRLLSRTIIPPMTKAGQCFEKGKSFVTKGKANKALQFEEAERISDFKPETTMNIALHHKGRKVGVLQLLREEGEEGFDEDDIKGVTEQCETIAEDLGRLIDQPNFVKALDLADDPEDTDASVIIFDLTRSSTLFTSGSSGLALQRMNQYFERLCEAAFQTGAVLDNYMGDGALLRFNIERNQPDHAMVAIEAAAAMSRAFDALRNEWDHTGLDVEGLFYRAGVASGPLLRGNLGHSQSRRLTIVGPPISVAAALCNAGDRSRSIILADETTYQAVKDRVVARPLDHRLLDKAAMFTKAAYEIQGLR